MSEELMKAIKERINLGHSDESIREELLAAGYDEEAIASVLQSARKASENFSESANNTAVIPSGWSLFKEGLSFALKRYDLALLLPLPFVILSVLEYVSQIANLKSDAHEASLGIASLVALVAYLLIMLSVLYIVANQANKEASFSEGFSWAKRRFWSFVLISILVTLAVWGGSLLFIIPGVVASIYLYLSNFILVLEDRKGIQALLRSRELIKGQWITVAVRLFMVGLFLILTFILIGMVFGLLAIPIANSSIVELFGAIIINILNGGMVIVGMFVGARLYRILSSMRPAHTAEIKEAKGRYIALIVMGGVAIILFIGFLITVAYLFEQEDLTNDVVPTDINFKDKALEFRLEE